MFRTALVALALAGVNAAAAPGPSAPVTKPFNFVVIGHIRGDRGHLNPELAELLQRVRALKPAFVVVTGDMIWGDADLKGSVPEHILTEWTAVDSALATLKVPVYRTPGNHDINDIVTRDIYFQRYGKPPSAFSYGGSRFLILASTYLPPDGDTAKMEFIRGHDLDSSQVGFIRAQLADTASYQHTFAFMHHLLWWEPTNGAWWRDVHPLLEQHKGAAVFSGDLGPMKFSHLQADGIEYYQCSLGGNPPMNMMRNAERNRALQDQFDCFFNVTVDGPAVDVQVEAVGEVSMEHFTPARWDSIYGYRAPPPQSLREKFADLTSSRGRVVMLVGGLLLAFVAGWGIARMTASKRA